MPKRYVRRIDTPPALSIGGGDVISTAETFSAPVPAAIAGPSGVTVTTSQARSSAAPSAFLDVVWTPPVSAIDIAEYQTRHGKLADLSDGEIRTTRTNSARLEVAAAQQWHVQVRSLLGAQYSEWVNASPFPITSASDATPAAQPTSLAATFSGAGDLVVTYTPSVSENSKDVELKLYESAAKAVLYGTFYNGSGRFVWSASENLAAAPAGTGKTTVFVEARSRTWSNVVNSVSVPTATATDAIPGNVSSVTATGYYQSAAVTWTATKPDDFKRYVVRVVRNGVTFATLYTTTEYLSYEMPTRALYEFGVKIEDVFGQVSAVETLSGITSPQMTLDELRESILYSDSVANAAATLKAALADDNRTSGGITYGSSASWSSWVQADWQLKYRFRTITLTMFPTSGTTNWYLRFSNDAVTWNYYAGPVVATGSTGVSTTLTAVANAAAAQTAAISSATLGNSANNRIDLPAMIEARYVELWFRNTGANTRIDEFYPRRLVQTDDLQSESISALLIAANAVTADKISANAIDGKTITGATVRTSASNPRVELNSTALTTYDSSGVAQITAGTATGGKLTAGGGVVMLDSTGIDVAASSLSDANVNSYGFTSGGSQVGGVYANSSSGTIITLASRPVATFQDAQAKLEASTLSGGISTARLTAYNAAAATTELILTAASGLSSITLTAGSTKVTNGLNVGTATGATAGQISTSGNVGIRVAPDAAIALKVKGTGTGAAYGLNVVNNSNTNNLILQDDGFAYIRAASWSYGSDERLKDGIKDHTRGLEDVKRLKPRMWKYKGRTTDSSGFVAQELEDVAPELVDTLADGTKAIRTTELIPTLVKALQELTAQVTSLQTEVATLKQPKV